MSVRKPLVLADDGLVSQLQAGDRLPGDGALAQLLIQNNAIIRLLASVAITVEAADATLSDSDVEQFIAELTP